jgi:flagellar motility protein MotE (MotC chaperone)
MKTIVAYILGFSVTFTVIAGGMYFLSEKYPWMFGQSDAQTVKNAADSAAVPSSGGLIGLSGAGAGTGSPGGENQTILTLRKILAAKNDTISVRDDSIRALNQSISQLQTKTSDANGMIAQLQSEVHSWKSKKKADLASAYNDMDPAAAAKIMANLDDSDIIFILSTIQKKQAGKILGDLDPTRAARLMMSLNSSK